MMFTVRTCKLLCHIFCAHKLSPKRKKLRFIYIFSLAVHPCICFCFLDLFLDLIDMLIGLLSLWVQITQKIYIYCFSGYNSCHLFPIIISLQLAPRPPPFPPHLSLRLSLSAFTTKIFR